MPPFEIGQQDRDSLLRAKAVEASGLAKEAANEELHRPFWETLAFKQATAEFAGTTAAGTTGVVAFGIGWAAKRSLVARAATLAIAPALGGLAKHGVKLGIDDFWGLHGDERTANDSDYLTGALDAFAGITGSLAEKKVSQYYTGFVGRRALTRRPGTLVDTLKHEFTSWAKGKPATNFVSEKCAVAEGERILSQDVLPQITHNVLRGLAGGAVGSFTWSAPHRISENLETIKADSIKGLFKTASEIGLDTTIGTAFGGTTAGLFTTAFNSRYLGRYWLAKAHGDRDLTRLDVAYFNDAHGQVVGDRNFARAASKIDELRAQSQSLDGSGKFKIRRNFHFYENGDLENANVSASFTGWGKLENKIIARLKPNSRTIGNHPYDVEGPGHNVQRYADILGEVNKATGKKMPIVAANLDFSQLPKELRKQYKNMIRHYLVHDLKGPNGQPVKAATIGLVTEEGAIGGIRYQDPARRLEETIAKIRKKHPEINIFIVQSHLGDELDRQIAATNKDISVIFGAHSHKAFSSPVWVNNGKRDVAVMQAGSYLSHVGEANLAFNPDGSLNRFYSSNRLHALTTTVPENEEIKELIKQHIPQQLDDLCKLTYNSVTQGRYTLDNVRRGENTTANLIVDALVDDYNKRLPVDLRPDIVTAQSGFIRTGFPANKEISRLDLCKTIINAGSEEGEKLEQAFLNVTGAKFKEILEYGVEDLSAPQEPGLKGFIKQLFNRIITGKSMPYTDDPQGNLLHINGSYTIDLTKPAGKRVSNIKINEGGVLKPLDEGRTYSWATRWHYSEKVYNRGIFNSLFQDRTQDLSLKEAYKLTNATPFRRSIPEAVGDYIRGKNIDPNIHGKIEGRIIDATPAPLALHLGPGPSIPSFSLLAGRDTMSDNSTTQH